MRLSVLVCVCVFTACQAPKPSLQEEEPAAAPVASFSVTGDLIEKGTVLFDASASTGDTLTYSWSFGDGTLGGAQKLVHLFGAAGTYRVTLTVTDGSGKQGAASQDVVILSGPALGAAIPLTLTVRDAQGVVVVGADVSVTGSPSAAKTDANGSAVIAVATASEQTVRVFKPGYTHQIRVVSYPSSLTTATLNVTMLTRAAALSLADAAAGGSLEGTNGARITLPAGALVDDQGTPITGAIDVAITPLDVRVAGSQFPGGFGARDQNGQRGVMLSYGVTEFDLRQEGKHLNVAPGSRAIVELPMSATTHANGLPIAVGDEIPLWSLDEQVGTWVQEGSGIVVASSSATGFALRAELGHFSWWNGDAIDPSRVGVAKCRVVDVTATQEKIDLVEAGVCYIGANFGDNTGSARDSEQPPVYARDIQVPFNQTVAFPLPRDVPMFIDASAVDGTWGGSTTLAPGLDGRVEIDLVIAFKGTPAPTGPSGTTGPVAPLAVTLPLDRTDALQNVGDVQRYELTSTNGGRVRIDVNSTGVLTGTMQVDQCTVNVGVSVASCLLDTSAGQVLDITVTATANAPGAFRLAAIAVQANLVTLPYAQAMSVNGGNPAETSIVFDALAGHVYELGTVGAQGSGVPVFFFTEVATGVRSIERQFSGTKKQRLIAPRDGQYMLTMRNSTTALRTVQVDLREITATITEIAALPYFVSEPSIVGTRFLKVHATAGQHVAINIDGPSTDIVAHGPLATFAYNQLFCPETTPSFVAPADGDYYFELTNTSVSDLRVTVAEVQDLPLNSHDLTTEALADGEARFYRWTQAAVTDVFYESYAMGKCLFGPDGGAFDLSSWSQDKYHHMVLAGTYTIVLEAQSPRPANSWGVGVSTFTPPPTLTGPTGTFAITGEINVLGEQDYYFVPITSGQWVGGRSTSTFSATVNLSEPNPVLWDGATVYSSSCNPPKRAQQTGNYVWHIGGYNYLGMNVGTYEAIVRARNPLAMTLDGSGDATGTQPLSGLCDFAIRSFTITTPGFYRHRTRYLGANLHSANALLNEIRTAAGASVGGSGHFTQIQNDDVNSNSRFSASIAPLAAGEHYGVSYGYSAGMANFAGDMEWDLISIAPAEDLVLNGGAVTRSIDRAGRHRFFRVTLPAAGSFTVTIGGSVVGGRFYLYRETATYYTYSLSLTQNTTLPNALSNTANGAGDKWIVAVAPNEIATGDFTISVTQ